MPHPISRRILLFGLLMLLPVPVTALLCRGYTPSRLDTSNLPPWEHRLPQAAPLCHPYALSTAEPGKNRISDYSLRAPLLQTDENQLLRGAEQKHRGDAAAAGLWLESACAWGREDRALREKQDRVAERLMSTQCDDGFLGVRLASARWTVRDTAAQTDCLRGLLAYYAQTHRPAAIFAALSAADRLMAEHPSDPSLIFPLTRLYQVTSDARYLRLARRQSQSKISDGLGLCALYEAAGRSDYLTKAQRTWSGSKSSPALSAELLLLTGRSKYAAALNDATHTGPEMLRTACTQTPHGFVISTAGNCAGEFPGVTLTQQTVTGKGRVISIRAAKPKAFTLEVFMPAGPPVQVRVNGTLQKTEDKPGGYAMFERRWRNGDIVTMQTTKSPPVLKKSLES